MKQKALEPHELEDIEQRLKSHYANVVPSEVKRQGLFFQAMSIEATNDVRRLLTEVEQLWGYISYLHAGIPEERFNYLEYEQWLARQEKDHE